MTYHPTMEFLRGLDHTHVAGSLRRDLIAALQEWQLWTMLGWNDVRQRYRRSVLGPFWITLSMGSFILLLGAIYSRLFNMEIKTYLPYLTLGFIVWGFISTSMTEGCTAFQEGERIIKQIRLPYSIYVLRVVWRNFIVFLHTIVIFIPMVVIFDVRLAFVSLLAIPGIGMIYLNQVWLTLALAIMSTRFRDMIPIVTTAVQIVFFATPIMWPVSALGDSVYIADINPLYHLIELVRAPMLGAAPRTLSWIVAGATLISGWLIAIWLLQRASRRIVFWL
jgi:lipopolysaccharide transport system permease protein